MKRLLSSHRSTQFERQFASFLCNSALGSTAKKSITNFENLELIDPVTHLTEKVSARSVTTRQAPDVFQPDDMVVSNFMMTYQLETAAEPEKHSHVSVNSCTVACIFAFACLAPPSARSR